MAICNSFLCSLSQVVLGTEPSFIIQNLVILPGRPPGFLESPTRQVGKGEHLHLSTAQKNWAGGCLVFGVAENSQVGGRLVLGVTQSPGRAGARTRPALSAILLIFSSSFRLSQKPWWRRQRWRRRRRLLGVRGGNLVLSVLLKQALFCFATPTRR